MKSPAGTGLGDPADSDGEVGSTSPDTSVPYKSNPCESALFVVSEPSTVCLEPISANRQREYEQNCSYSLPPLAGGRENSQSESNLKRFGESLILMPTADVPARPATGRSRSGRDRQPGSAATFRSEQPGPVVERSETIARSRPAGSGGLPPTRKRDRQPRPEGGATTGGAVLCCPRWSA